MSAMEDLAKKRAALEALLFIHGEPLSHKKIMTVLGIKKEDDLEEVIAGLAEELDREDRGLTLIKDKEKLQLATKSEWSGILEAFVKEEISEDLTPASLEALAIIAYLGPISRAKIEYLRGVNSIVILRSLMIRGLVERIPDPERSSGFLYKTTFDLMKHLGVKESGDLPDFEKFQELMKAFEPSSAETPAAPAPEPAAESDSMGAPEQV